MARRQKDDLRTEVNATITAHDALAALPRDQQERAVGWILTRLGLTPATASISEPITRAPRGRPRGRKDEQFSEKETSALRALVQRRRPETELERVAVLASYVTASGQKTFGTRDLTSRSKAAGLPPFTNASVAMISATDRGAFERAGTNGWRLTPAGKAFVDALPDREAARSVLGDGRGRR